MVDRGCSTAGLHTISRVERGTPQEYKVWEKRLRIHTLLGLCEYDANKNRVRVTVRADFKGTPYDMLEPLYHEMGHCALGLSHYKGIDTISPHIMDAGIHRTVPALEQWGTMRDELFEQCERTDK